MSSIVKLCSWCQNMPTFTAILPQWSDVPSISSKMPLAVTRIQTFHQILWLYFRPGSTLVDLCSAPYNWVARPLHIAAVSCFRAPSKSPASDRSTASSQTRMLRTSLHCHDQNCHYVASAKAVNSTEKSPRIYLDTTLNWFSSIWAAIVLLSLQSWPTKGVRRTGATRATDTMMMYHFFSKEYNSWT